MPLTLKRNKNKDKAKPALVATTATIVPKKDKKKKAPAVAHIVARAQLAAAKRGEDVKSLCGDAKIIGDPEPGAPICQKCVLAQLEVDDVKSSERVQHEIDRARTTTTQLRTDLNAARADAQRAREQTMREIREAAERRALEVKQAAVS